MDVVPYLSSLIPPFSLLNLTTVVHPIMYSLSSVLLAGSLALQTAFSLPQIKERDSEILKRAVDSFIDIETPIAYAGVLCNIGGTGACVAGAGSGLVIAGPGKTSPDFASLEANVNNYDRTRDAALTFKALVDAFIVNYDADLQNEIEAYITAQSRLQTVNTPSGGLSSGGLAEPKYLADGSAFTGSWGRPQRDGPALRATALIAYSKWLIANGYTSTANDLVWPVIQNDLSYVTQYWYFTLKFRSYLLRR
ncbi:hypothetical protein HYALB_00012811 [Hymenoscyphus albidus]|uniref:glucan 1,4-alpha-glucosidase n=1 Tax=Hymenoscyphus albidus TaxID=595503 RepID=A0A9N9LZ02_9HELO|nr:hypothetical protein HYALB_00012811 [Hymenoscyphus albidus]